MAIHKKPTRGLTIVEKIISSHSGNELHRADITVATIDTAMATDGSGPLMIEYFKKMGGTHVFDPTRVLLIMDHYVPSPNDKVSRLQDIMRNFAAKGYGTIISLGEGICHQLLPEMGYIRPGHLVVGADSHSTTYGALNSLGVGIGSSDLAAAIISGALWFSVPETIKVNLSGHMKEGVGAKDLALYLVGIIGSSGANYCAIEFQGEEEELPLTIEGRMTVCNLMAETGAKCAIMPGDQRLQKFYKTIGLPDIKFVEADNNAVYCRMIEIELSRLEPMISCPHSVANVVPISNAVGTPIQMGLLGTCANGRIEDFAVALDVMGEKALASGFQLIIVPASRRIYTHMAENGMLAQFSNKGALILPPSCGPCCGSNAGTPSDGYNVISSANRNFIGRMGNTNSYIFLASPASVAAAAVTGYITDPRGVKL
jgi:3-isopropylmalate/(R)-2-methylmalate dehydratase large subunit